MKKQKLVVLSGAGVSAESGIKTYRDNDGLWENYPVEQVASIEGWYRDKALMLKFYNERRRQLATASPNLAHEIIASLELPVGLIIIRFNFSLKIILPCIAPLPVTSKILPQPI